MVLLNDTELNKYDDIIADIVLELIEKHSINPSIFLGNNILFYKNIEIKTLFKNVENEGIEIYST